MRYEPSRIGVCVIRIEMQSSSGVLITLLKNPDVEQVSTAQTCVLSDVDGAIQAVQEFLRSFTLPHESTEHR